MRTNVLWIASGEHDSIHGFRLPITAAQKAVLTAAARGIREATGGRQLITVHPGVARTSSGDFHGESWLDFNMLQSGHQMDCEAYKLAENHAFIAHAGSDYLNCDVNATAKHEALVDRPGPGDHNGSRFRPGLAPMRLSVPAHAAARPR